MTDFAITAAQRQALLNGSRRPLEFDRKPWVAEHERGLERGDRYVLVKSQATNVLCDDGYVIPIPARPVWWITVTRVQRHRKGHWTVLFDSTDLRDPPMFLKAQGGYTSSRYSAIDDLEVVPKDWLTSHAKVVSEFDHAARLARHAELARGRSRAKRRRSA